MSYDLITSPADVQPRFRRIASVLSLAMLTASADDPDATTPLLLWGTGVPGVSAPNGSVAIRHDGGTAAEVLYFRQGGAWRAAELNTGVLRAFVEIPGGDGAGNAGDLSSSPQEVVAAPGLGFYIEPISAHCWLDYNSAAYDVAGDLDINLGAGGPSTLSLVVGAGFNDQASDQHRVALTEGTIPAIENTALVAEASADWFGAAGDSPLKIEVLYRVRAFEPVP